MGWAVALLMLTGMEIILGVDNILFLSMVVGGLPEDKQRPARFVGLSLALGARMLLLCGIRWMMGVDKALFHLGAHAVTWRDLVLVGGGLFLIVKSGLEIHEKVVADEDAKDEPKKRRAPSSFLSAIVQIVILDLVFSLDSILSALAMARQLWIMIAAMTVAVGLMAFCSGAVSKFIETHPTFKMLALSFLVFVGIVLVADGSGVHIHRAYVYTAMCFALGVELLNMRARQRRAKRLASKVTASQIRTRDTSRRPSLPPSAAHARPARARS